MKKSVTILTFLITIFIAINVYAEDLEIEFNMTGETSIQEGTETYEVTIGLGNFTNITSINTLAFMGTLGYDTNIFENVTVKGLNNWTLNYSSNTNNIIGETDSAAANISIAKITFTLKDNVEPTEDVSIKFNNIELSNGEFELNYNKEVIFDIIAENNSNNNINNNVNTINTNTNTTSSNQTYVSNIVDYTTSNNVIPKAGIKNFFIGTILVIIIVSIIFKIKSKDIKY